MVGGGAHCVIATCTASTVESDEATRQEDNQQSRNIRTTHGQRSKRKAGQRQPSAESNRQSLPPYVDPSLLHTFAYSPWGSNAKATHKCSGTAVQVPTKTVAVPPIDSSLASRRHATHSQQHDQEVHTQEHRKQNNNRQEPQSKCARDGQEQQKGGLEVALCSISPTMPSPTRAPLPAPHLRVRTMGQHCRDDEHVQRDRSAGSDEDGRRCAATRSIAWGTRQRAATAGRRRAGAARKGRATSRAAAFSNRCKPHIDLYGISAQLAKLFSSLKTHYSSDLSTGALWRRGTVSGGN